MLKHRSKTLLAIMALVLGAALSAAAEARASIPFDFVVQGTTYPAGTYDVVATSSPRVVILRNEANLKQSFMLILPLGESLTNGSAQLTLHPKGSTGRIGQK